MGSINHDNLDEYIEEEDKPAKKCHDWFQHIHNSPDHMQSCSFRLDDPAHNKPYDDGKMPN
jgi:hypothetical protein